VRTWRLATTAPLPGDGTSWPRRSEASGWTSERASARPSWVLNGAGLRKRAFFRVYVAGLYLIEKRTSSQEVLALGGPKRVSITLMRISRPASWSTR